jgi:protein TonB
VVPEIGIPVPLGKLLLVAVRKAGDLPLDQLAEDASLQIELSSDALRPFKAEDLEDGERHLLSLISQRISAKHVVSQSRMPRPEASRALYALLLLGFVVGVAERVQPEREPVVPTPPAALEQPKAVEAPSATNIPEERAADVPVPAEEATVKASEAPFAGNVTHAQPEFERTPDAEASALAELRGEVHADSAIPKPDDPFSTEAILESGLEAAGAVAPTKRDADRARWEAAEQAETPQGVSDLTNTLPKSKRWRLPRGGFTPEFNRAMRTLAILLVVLAVPGVGIAWFKNWLPWKSAGAKPKNPTAYAVKVASDAPVTSEGMPAKSAPIPDENATVPTDGSATPVEAASSGAPGEPLASRKKASRAMTAAKAPSVRPAANPKAPSGQDSAVVPPKLIHSVQAVASMEALRDFERGNVVIDAVVGTSGEVHVISVISGPPSLREPAVESLKQYKYEPATRNGQPVPAHVTISIHFRFEP